MTRVLRISMYGGLFEPPVTMVVGEGDVAVPLEEAAAILHNPPDMLVITEIMESHGSDISAWTADALVRAESRHEDEHNMSILYWWVVGMHPMMVDGGMIGTQRPTPLPVESIAYVFRALAQRSDFRSFQYITRTVGGDIIEYRGQEVYVNGEAVPAPS